MEGKRFGLYGVLLVAALTLAYEVHAEPFVQKNGDWKVMLDDKAVQAYTIDNQEGYFGVRRY